MFQRHLQRRFSVLVQTGFMTVVEVTTAGDDFDGHAGQGCGRQHDHLPHALEVLGQRLPREPPEPVDKVEKQKMRKQKKGTLASEKATADLAAILKKYGRLDKTPLTVEVKGGEPIDLKLD